MRLGNYLQVDKKSAHLSWTVLKVNTESKVKRNVRKDALNVSSSFFLLLLKTTSKQRWWQEVGHTVGGTI